MSEFNPSPYERVTIGGYGYQVMPHPAVPTFAFGQEGRKAFVFQVSAENGAGLYALKKFKLAFRVSELVEVCDKLARYASWPGLEVCARQCLHQPIHSDVLGVYPDLEYAVLMPWISGSTWYDMVIGERPLDRLTALNFANAVAQVLAALEESGLAHCDISAANVIISHNSTTGEAHAHLIDVEDLYAPDFDRPSAVPMGTDGYAHKTSSQGLWHPMADRFAGAILMIEMAGWFDPNIRRAADEEHFFAVNEMQQDTDDYRLMRRVLGDIDERLPDLFDQMWFSDTLQDCPPLKAWQEVFADVYQRERLARVVSDWQPISVPTGGLEDATPRPFVAPEPPPPPVEEIEEPAPPADLSEHVEEPRDEPISAQPPAMAAPPVVASAPSTAPPVPPARP
ncbi:MAG: hypothetical protein GYB68_00975, partial [Chloroflexi bacterium]|nr:hypothetical protein [Chloroflexota bacterium]